MYNTVRVISVRESASGCLNGISRTIRSWEGGGVTVLKCTRLHGEVLNINFIGSPNRKAVH